MTSPRSSYLPIVGHEVHLTAWGDPAAPALVLWHGVARTGRDFDTLARRFADRFHVLCPDTIGRGLSSWSAAPAEDYTIPAYCGHALELLDRLGIAACRWVGTSMGGLIGMALAGTPETAPRIERLVLNDIAPRLNQVAIDRILAYVTLVPEFATMIEFETFLRAVYAPFGRLSDDEWRLLAETSMRRRENGRISSHYDPAVMRVFAEQAADFDMWAIFDAITCPVLALRGEVSDLVEPHVAEEMTGRGPKARLVTIPGCGHAPALNTPEQFAVLEEFLG
ncbi:alpha/beta fold hydrolase [Candidatus Thiodictyon syntrophicum]|jgi:pimeloyl-ACP methyl ester carboxylesterase|uniref:Alpha/beta hydrolase n=1 Tax=Candidatus Thiodictyon syntrophicum TaxID=1166950 RepID=A0A2K8UAQ1_9GAMM|nr:alpha/beta hydrolase [Candidatus Thiodictyon syntrophicum]AUB82652.1 alpha/beta hydrolase [Candidatus Thiodictyon syntrophicum]